MPAVRESVDEQPDKLELVPTGPGSFLKLNRADKEAYLASRRTEPAPDAEVELVPDAGLADVEMTALAATPKRGRKS